MARALLVGCGCRGRALGTRLLDDGWQVRGTTRREDGLAAIEAAGIEAVAGDPDRIATVLDHIEGVTAIGWLLGSARGEPDAIAAIHGPRLERLCEELVDTPVRGVVYQTAGTVGREHLREGARVLQAASDRWRMPFEPVDADPADWPGWVDAAAAAFRRLTGR
jgi:uncharacterized protein YbjT (DUF2867 family)